MSVQCTLYILCFCLTTLHHTFCAIPCTTNADLAGCIVSDTKCLCTNQKFISSTTVCVQTAWTGDDLANALKFSQNLWVKVVCDLSPKNHLSLSKYHSTPSGHYSDHLLHCSHKLFCRCFLSFSHHAHIHICNLYLISFASLSVTGAGITRGVSYFSFAVSTIFHVLACSITNSQNFIQEELVLECVSLVVTCRIHQQQELQCKQPLER